MTSQAAVIRVKNREVSSNTYLYPIDPPGSCLLIDPGLDSEAIDAALKEHGLTPSAILCTHGHFDHLGSAELFRRRFSIQVHLNAADAKIARASNFMMMALKLPSRIIVPEVFATLQHGVLSTGSQDVAIVHAPGHTKGSVVFFVGGCAFTGDTLYRDDVWRMPWPEEDANGLIESVQSLWESVPDKTLIYPGHGGSATFGSIKERNAPLRRMLGVDEVVSA